MGSYGIGPARIIAAAIEQRADERGIVWPRSIAPWQVHLVSLAKAGEPEREVADRIYEELIGERLEVLYDDRDAGPGEKLTDSELLGCPLRVVAGRKSLAEGQVETQSRAGGEERRVSADGAAAEVASLLEGLD
jgi:prolyl-tRNA synthetase